MKYRLFLEFDDQLMNPEKFTIKEIERHGEVEPYSLIELDGNLSDVRIRRPCGLYFIPKETIPYGDYEQIIRWSFSHLK